jgi:hypothetical protein
MHTLSTRTLSALAYDRGEEYDPAMPGARMPQRTPWMGGRVVECAGFESQRIRAARDVVGDRFGVQAAHAPARRCAEFLGLYVYFPVPR